MFGRKTGREMEDSRDKWRYAILLSKFTFSCIDVSISKSFGVMIPVMVVVLQTDAKTLGFVCSLPSSLIYLASPIVAYTLNKGWMSPRMCALLGAIFSSACLVTGGMISSIPALALSLAITGTGLSMGYLSSKIMLNEYFKESYVLAAGIANMGNTTGALIAPYIVERALSAYGYVGAMVILGGLSLHAIPASIALRNRTDGIEENRNEEAEEMPTVILIEEMPSTSYSSKSRKRTHSYRKIMEDGDDRHLIPEADLENSHDTTREKFRSWLQSCIVIKEPLMCVSSPSIFLTMYGLTSWVLFLVPRAEWHGIPGSKAVFLSTLAGAGGIVGRLVYIALIYSGCNAIVISLAFNIITAITFLLDPLINTFPKMGAVAFVQGWCLFTCLVSTSAYPKYAVAPENFTFAAGLQGLLAGMGGMIGGFMSGFIKDASRSFTTVFLVLGGVFVLNTMTTSMFYVAYRRRMAANSSSGD
ncbi:monocarboxylate transporter 4-like [Lytechinus pictus]|uniref:monocarboxylate transporter 4-like n=1 Tax=Lytechinus pictus TaxID=7653 RepID=UPI0030B9CA86